MQIQRASMTGLIGGVEPSWVPTTVDIPTIRAGQLLIKVRAAGVNRADLLMLQGSYNAGGKARQTYTAGLELAGDVVEVGADAEGFEVGDRVMGLTLGSFASYARIDYRHAIPIPPGLSWSEAAALPIGLATEHDALVTQAGFVAGQSVLIVGATTGIGMIGVQLAVALGASQVITTTTSAAKAEKLKAVGADIVVDTSSEDIVEAVHGATSGNGVDVVLDHVGGELFASLLLAAKPGGVIINIGRLAGASTHIDLDQMSFRRLRLIGTTFSARTSEETGVVCSALNDRVMPAVAPGAIRPIIHCVIPFDDAEAAVELLRTNQAVGKIVLDLADIDPPLTEQKDLNQ